MIEKQDGVTLILNLWNDTVFIHTQANLNDTWRFYDDTSQNYYKAAVTASDTATISGALDSLKIITINAYNTSGINTSDSINGKQIILSKHHGVYQTFALYSFPFPQGLLDYYMDKTERMSNNGVIQVFKTITPPYPNTFQLYDFNVGDVFQFLTYAMSSSVPNSLMQDSIMNKNILSPTDIEYSVHSVSKNIMYPNLPTIIIRKDTIKLDILEWFDDNLMPDEWGSPDFVYYNEDDTSLCLKSPLINSFGNWLSGNGMLNNFEPNITQSIDKIGFGGIYGYIRWGSGGGAFMETKLSFSKKNGIPCGSYTSPLSANDLNEFSKSITISPNPAGEKLFIQTDLNSYQVIMYTITGAEVMRVNSLLKTGELPVTDLVNGVYFLKIFFKEANGFVTKKVVVQR